jgi:hypothetical protein
MKFLKKFFEPQNELMLIGLLSILVLIWIILYAVPGILSSLFNTLLGKFILLLFVILVSYKNVKIGVILFIILIIIYRLIIQSNTYSGIKEGFTWKKDDINEFLEIQKLLNPHVVFDISEIQKQASPKDVKFFIKHRYWPWSKKTQKLYIETLNNNPYVRTDPETALETVRTIYNEKAILQLLSWQAKEGQFLRNGVSIHRDEMNKYQALPNGWGDYAFNSGQIRKTDNVIKCGLNKNKGLSLQQIEFKGNGGILNEHVKEITQVDYNNLENLIPGFKFLDGPCNPCEALNDPPNYNCPFQLELKKEKNQFLSDEEEDNPNYNLMENSNENSKKISPIWKYLWFCK